MTEVMQSQCLLQPSVATFLHEKWNMTVRTAHTLNVFHQRRLREILWGLYKDHITHMGRHGQISGPRATIDVLQAIYGL